MPGSDPDMSTADMAHPATMSVVFGLTERTGCRRAVWESRKIHVLLTDVLPVPAMSGSEPDVSRRDGFRNFSDGSPRLPARPPRAALRPAPRPQPTPRGARG